MTVVKYLINMMSKAYTVKGQGVSSAYDEQVTLLKNGLADKYTISENKLVPADITHYHTVNPEFFLSLPFVKRNGVTVGYVHFLPETLENSLKLPPPAKKIFYKYLISFYRHMDYLVTVNPCFIDKLAAYGIDRKKITYIPNFVCGDQFYPMESYKKQPLREQYGLDKDKFTVVCAGQLQRRKGIFDFVECAKRLPEMQFIWAGGFSFGHISDGYEEIKKIVDNPPENLKFLGIIEREKMNEIYNMGDVLFLASYEELFPMTILEAMNCKLPILLRDVQLYENILFDYYLKAKDVDGFVSVLKRLAQDPAYLKQAQESSWRGHEFYNKDHVLTMWDNFYSEVMKNRPAGRKYHYKKSEKKKAATRPAVKKRPAGAASVRNKKIKTVSKG